MKTKTVLYLTLFMLAGQIVHRAGECGNGGNTYWTHITTESSSASRTAAQDETNLLRSVDTTLYAWSKQNGNPPLNSRNFGKALGRPVPFVTTYPSSEGRVMVATRDGYIFALYSSVLNNVWSRSTRRASCSSDGIIATPAVQLWGASDDTFRALNTDLVFVGTAYGCSSTTANKVFALKASDGSPAWIFNNTGAYQMDQVHGLAVDYSRNTVFAVTDHRGSEYQNTVWALASTNGSKRWSVNLGDIRAEPLVANDSLYIVNANGVLWKLNPATGGVIWNVQLTCAASVVSDMAFQAGTNRLFITDSSGVLHAVDDLGACARRRWALLPGTIPVFVTAPAVAESENRLYAGDSSGKVWQINSDTGASLAWADFGGAVSEVLVKQREPVPYGGPRLFIIGGDRIKMLCVPWPDIAGDQG